jgi:hypothetical protein
MNRVRYGKCMRSDAQVSVKIVDTSKFRDEVDVSLKREVSFCDSILDFDDFSM